MASTSVSVAGPRAGDKVKTPEAYTIPIPSREPTSTWLQTLLFAIVFNFCIISDNLLQLIVFPLSLHSATKPYFDSVIAYTKLAFGRTLLVICQFFGPTRLVLSFGDGKGGHLDPNQFVRRDQQTGKITKVDLPQRSVWMSNHQVYTDWLYLWCLAYYSDLADSILIILKKSLKWIPLVGWGMQFFKFIFLVRNWAADQGPLSRQLEAVACKSGQGRKNENQGSAPPRSDELARKLLLLIFPEGTLVSPNTRPLSKKFADKMGYEDLENLLLPRSTGLLFCLRVLGREMDDLWLLDFVIGYPGIPPAGYGQSYYTLRSIFMQGVPPPAVHIHVIMTRVTEPASLSSNASSVASIPTASLNVPPLGNLSTKDSTEDEKKVFDEWVRNRWIQKDQALRQFYKDGDFVKGEFVESQGNTGSKYVVLPAELRSLREVGDAACWGISIIVLLYAYKAYRSIWS